MFLGFKISHTTIFITFPLGIMVSKKITRKFKLKIKEINRINDCSSLEDVKIINQILSNIQPNLKQNVPQKAGNLTCSSLTYENHSHNQSNNIIKKYNIDYRKYYRPRRYVTTLNELHFYEVLLEIAEELDLFIFCQVALYSIIETRKNLDYSTQTKFFNKISRKSIDFVLVDKNTCRIKLCIELDDDTHYRKKRIERDKFLKELFEQLEVNLLRYPSCYVYNKDDVKNKILEKMIDHYYTN